MYVRSFSKKDARWGKIIAYLLFGLGLAYIVITIMGFLNLSSPQEPISDPYFSLMEILIILMSPLLVLLMTTIYLYADEEKKLLSLSALLFMTTASAITMSLHYIGLYITEEVAAAHSWFFAFEWPSVIYALDILAWDFFFSISLLLAAFVFIDTEKRSLRHIRWFLSISGSLGLVGLLGPVTANMQIRNIGIVGYGVVFPFVCFLLGRFFSEIET